MATRTGPCYPSRARSGPALPIAQAQSNAFQGVRVLLTYVHVWKILPRDRLDPGSLEYSPQTTGDCYKIWLRQSFCLSESHNHSAARTVEG